MQTSDSDAMSSTISEVGGEKLAIARSFVEWSNAKVIQWLSTLSLSQDYAEIFKDINGSSLLQLGPAALDELNITDIGDRVKILQNLTTIRADLLTATPTHVPATRQRSVTKARRFSETSHRPLGPSASTGRTLTRQSNSSSAMDSMWSRPLHYEPRASPHRPLPGGAGSPIGYQKQPRLGSSVKCLLSPTKEMHYVLETEEETDGTEDTKLGPTVNHKRYLSRSMDGLYKVGVAQRQENTSNKLVEILREENVNLKKELEVYYQRVRKLHRLEQELERIREEHRLLDVSSGRKEKLEAAMRHKLEGELRRLKEANLHQRAELHGLRRPGANTSVRKDGGPRREIQRRDTMIMRLIKQNKEQAIAREKLEQDLHTVKTALRERTLSTDTDTDGGQERKPSRQSTDNEAGSAGSVYADSMEKLRSVLMAMQTMSQKREKLEQRVRNRLEAEIKQLKGEECGKGATCEVSHREGRIAVLEADIAKWEHKCLELVAERQMSLEVALVPRDARISHLERLLIQSEDTIDELCQQKQQYVDQLAEANKHMAELQTSVSSLKATVQEKEQVIQMMQQSFLEPEVDQDHLYSSLHHTQTLGRPVSFKRGNSHLLTMTRYLSGSSGEIPTHFSSSPPATSILDVADPSTVTMANGGMPMQSTKLNGVHHLRGTRQVDLPRPLSNTRKPRLSQPNLFNSTETSTYARSHAPAPPSLVTMATKSKTPPPDYRAVQVPTKPKKRHGSVGTTLDDNDGYTVPAIDRVEQNGFDSGLDQLGWANGHLEFFDSLIGKGVERPKAFLNSTYRHAHTSSSPTYNSGIHL